MTIENNEILKALKDYFTEDHTSISELSDAKIRVTSAAVLPTIYIEEQYNKVGILTSLAILGECEDERLGPYKTVVYPHEFDTMKDFRALFKKRLLALLDEATVDVEEQKWKDRQLNLFK